MLESVEQRNARVEADKAWEISFTRRGIIALGTYVIIGGYLNFLNVNDAWLHAFVSPIAYLISTLTLPLYKRIWLRHFYRS